MSCRVFNCKRKNFFRVFIVIMDIAIKNRIPFCGVSGAKPFNSTIKKIPSLNCVDTFTLSRGVLDEYSLHIVNEIRELFELAHSTIKSVAKSCNTRNAIKNGYPNIKKGIAGSRILEFSKIGEKGEDISVNIQK